MKISDLAKSPKKVTKIQQALEKAGYLDPNNFTHLQMRRYDGLLGLNTESALRRFGVRIGDVDDDFIEDATIERLLDGASAFPALSCQDDPAGKIVKYMVDNDMWVSMDPETLNIVYLEGVSEGFFLNDNALDGWNDLRVTIRVLPSGVPVIVNEYAATTGPGLYYTEKPMNKLGAARIAFGQYKSWVDGLHQGRQPALVQDGIVMVYRDLNKDGSRVGDKMYPTLSTLNQHSTSLSYTGSSVGKFSAGCLVGRDYQRHMEWHDSIRKDPRYQANKGYRFMSAILPGDKIFLPNTL